jgi:hypothetical protein
LVVATGEIEPPSNNVLTYPSASESGTRGKVTASTPPAVSPELAEEFSELGIHWLDLTADVCQSSIELFLELSRVFPQGKGS